MEREGKERGGGLGRGKDISGRLGERMRARERLGGDERQQTRRRGTKQKKTRGFPCGKAQDKTTEDEWKRGRAGDGRMIRLLPDGFCQMLSCQVL